MANRNEQLREAAKNGDVKKIKRLIAAGADVNARSEGEKTFHGKGQQEYEHAAQLLSALLEQGTDAIEAGLIPAEVLQGLEENFQLALSFTPKGTTALMLAAENGHEQAVQALLAAGADIHAVNENGDSALVCATGNGHEAVFHRLMEAGADIHHADKDGNTPLMAAAAGGNTAILRAMLAAGAQANTANAYGRTALMVAAVNGHEDALAVLLAAGADVHARDDEGSTALTLAAEAGCAALLRRLLDAGAQVDAADEGGWTALMFATGTPIDADDEMERTSRTRTDCRRCQCSRRQQRRLERAATRCARRLRGSPPLFAGSGGQCERCGQWRDRPHARHTLRRTRCRALPDCRQSQSSRGQRRRQNRPETRPRSAG